MNEFTGQTTHFDPDAYLTAARALLARRRVAVPKGYRFLELDVLSGLLAVPCPVYVREGAQIVLYADTGADAAEIRSLTSAEVGLLVREEDTGSLRQTVVRRISRVLADDRLPPADRSRVAYAMASQVVAELFLDGHLDRASLWTSHHAIDAIVQGLADEESLYWELVATMQRHLSTHTHAINTAVYSAILASLLGIVNSEGVRNIGRGALLHDIGKVRVPPAILDKPGPLDSDEWQVIRTHPRAGYDMLIERLGTAPPYAHIILEHHERHDHSGYPGRQGGDLTPIDSQVVAIGDAYDALTSMRSYRAGYTPYDALRVMRFDMAGQFNDDILRAFIYLVGGRAGPRHPRVSGRRRPAVLRAD